MKEVLFKGLLLHERFAFDLREPPKPKGRATKMNTNTTAGDMHKLARQIQKDLTAAQIALTELTRQIASLPIDDPDLSKRRCPICGVVTRGPFSLAEHLYVSHDGPLPEHYRRAEQLAGLPPLNVDAEDRSVKGRTLA